MHDAGRPAWVPTPPKASLSVDGVMNTHTNWFRGLTSGEKSIYHQIRNTYEAHGDAGKQRFAQLSKEGMKSLTDSKTLMPRDILEHRRWLQNNKLEQTAKTGPGEELAAALAEGEAKPVEDAQVVEGGAVDVVDQDPAQDVTGQVDDGSTVDTGVTQPVDTGTPVDQGAVEGVIRDDQQGTGLPSAQDFIAENVIRGAADQGTGVADQDTGVVDQGAPERGTGVTVGRPDAEADRETGIPDAPVVTDAGQEGQVDQGSAEDIIRAEQGGDQVEQVADRLVEDANGNRFVVKADGTTYNMNNEVVDPVQGTDIATWDPAQGWISAHRDDEEEPTLADNMGLENAIEVSTPLSWDEVTRPRIDPGWAQRRVNVEYEQARQKIEQARQDQGWAGRGISSGLGTEYAHMVDPFVQSLTGARTAEAMIPYQTAIENEAWRRGLSDQQFQQMLGLAGTTADDWYKRAFRSQEFQRITDAMMQQFANPLLQSLLGSVFSGPEGMAMMESGLPGAQTLLGQSYNPQSSGQQTQGYQTTTW